MKNVKLNTVLSIILALLIMLLPACDNSDWSASEESPDWSVPKESSCQYRVSHHEAYQIVTPGNCDIIISPSNNRPGELRKLSFTPKFGNNPSPEPVERDYFFLVRPGLDEQNNPSRYLLINFMGGGACWEPENCLEHRTNYNYDQIKPVADAPHLLELIQAGVISSTNEHNPFKNWTLVYLPYTTGDVHWGSNDHSYTDSAGNKVTVNHRGHDNFLAALRYLKDTFPPETIDKIFVIGQSAGAYGAIFNFPYIRETYKDAAAYCLGDAGVGINTDSFLQTAVDRWKIKDNLADWVDGIDGDSFGNMSLGEFYRAVAQYYPETRFGQYTSQYDHNQRYFYYLMQTVKSPWLWNHIGGNGYYVPDQVSCDWVQRMRHSIDQAQTAFNYNVFVAPGEIHTITTSDNMYQVEADGVKFIDWLNNMLNDSTAWSDVYCNEINDGCQRPDTLDSPAGLICPELTVFPVKARVLVSGKFSQTEGIAFNRENRLFISANSGIYEVYPDGETRLLTDQIENPIGLAPGPENQIYVCNFGHTSFMEGSTENDGNILLLSPDGEFFQWGTGIPDPNFITISQDGSALVSDDFGQTIYRIPPEGGMAEPWFTGVIAPNGMAFSLDGKTLLVAQTFSQAGNMTVFDSRVWAVPLAEPYRSPGTPVLLADFGINGANDGIALDELGFVYVAVNVAGKIIRVNPQDGSYLVIAEKIPFVASLAFGQGDFSHTSIYATQLFGGTIWEIPVGVKGAPLH